MLAKSSESPVFKSVRRTEKKKPEKLSRAMVESILAGMCLRDAEFWDA